MKIQKSLFDVGQLVYFVKETKDDGVRIEGTTVTCIVYPEKLEKWGYVLGLYNVMFDEKDIFGTLDEAEQEYLKKKHLLNQK